MPERAFTHMWIGARISGVGTVLLACLVGAATGCGEVTKSTDSEATGEAGADGTLSGNDAGDTSDSSTGTGIGGAGGADATSTTGAGGVTLLDCEPGIAATSQVPRLLNREYDNILHDVLGVSGVEANEGRPPSSLLNDDFDGPMNHYAWDAYQNAADVVAAEVMASDNRSRFMSCDPTTDDGCYEDTIRSFGRKMFRRPLTDEEVARFLEFTEADANWTPDEISEAILYGFLLAPSFLMVPELNPELEGDAFRLSSYEMATRLSLMLWGSVPDDELNEAADQDMLATKEQILAQAERMIQVRGSAGPQVAAAHAAYLEMSASTSHWWKVIHDPEIFPDYTDDTQLAFQGEVDAFFEEVAFEGGTFEDIYLSNVAFVNRDSAAIYGLDPSDYDAELSLVELDASERPGIFTRGGFLSSFSSYDATSPIQRGAFLAVNVLGVNPGVPEPNAVVEPTPPVDYATRREQIEALTQEQPECAGCHLIINGPGFVLENFDAVGAWQTVDRYGGPIDTTANVTFADGSVRTISSPLELMEAIAEDPKARLVYAAKLVSFFTRRAPNVNDACLVNDVTSKLLEDRDYTMLDLIVDLTQADSFRLRTAEQ